MHIKQSLYASYKLPPDMYVVVNDISHSVPMIWWVKNDVRINTT